MTLQSATTGVARTAQLCEAGTLFVVDDEPLVRKALGRVLTGDGYDVHEYQNPEKALEALHELQPECIISDYYMPGTNGLTLLEEVKNRYPHVARVMLTGGLIDQSVLDALEKDIIHVLLQKPWHISSLRKMIEHIRAGDKRVFIGKDPIIQTSLQPRNQPLAEVTAVPARQQGPTLLLASHDQNTILMIRKRLSRIGCSVLIGDDDATVKRIMRNEDPQIVMIDVNDAGINGLELIESVREWSPFIPIVATASENRYAVVIDSLRRGATCFLSWPFDTKTVEATIQRCMQMDNLFTGQSHRPDLAALLQVQHAINSGIPEQQMLNLLLQEMIRQTDADRGTILLVDESGQNLRIAASYGLSDKVVRDELIPIGEQVSGWVVLNNQPRMIFGAAQQSGREEGSSEKKASVGLVLPMRGRDRVLGALCLSRFEGTRPFTRDSVDLGILLAGEVMRAIERNAADEHQRNLERNLARHDKLLTIGELAAGIAHEINNPLGYVNSNVDSLKKYLGSLTPALLHMTSENGGPDFSAFRSEIGKVKLEHILADLPECVEETQEGISRVLKIVADLKSLARDDNGVMENVDIHKVIEGAVNIVWNQIKYKAELVREYAEVPAMSCYPSKLGQVILNLLHNATQAIEKEGRIVLRTKLHNDRLLVEVEDNGAGMDADVLRQVFDPLFTTKPRGIGTGLGLNIARKIVQMHYGRIWAESTTGVGTTFTIELPLDGQVKSAGEADDEI